MDRSLLEEKWARAFRTLVSGAEDTDFDEVVRWFADILLSGRESEVADPDKPSDLEHRLGELLNGYENDSGTPDFILAAYLRRALDNYNETLQAREDWYDRPVSPPPGFGDFH